MSATTQAETTPSTPTGSGYSSPSRDIALIAAFAALVSASAYVGAIPVGSAGVPITLQTLTVMLAGCILGPLCEELLFRGLQPKSQARNGQKPAACVTAQLFCQ